MTTFLTRLSTVLLWAILLAPSLGWAQAAGPLWMRYPAISPDGQTIAFSYKGDIYTVPAEGGRAYPLTVHEDYDYNPVWSHDSKSIAFASDRYGNFDVFVMPATGGQATRLTYHSSADYPSDFSVDNTQVIFNSNRMNTASNAQFPGVFSQLYSVPVQGGQPDMIIDFPAEDAKYSKDGKVLVFHDWKGYENKWRKHHTSSVTRDVWTYNTSSKKYKQLSTFKGEDRNPVFVGEEVYYLSEQSGDFNVWKMGKDGSNPAQVTKFEKHPVRFLTKATNDTFCFSFHGEIYTMKKGGEPKKVAVKIMVDGHLNSEENVAIRGGANEMSVSPNGKEAAFIFRGEVFVTALDNGMTKRITNTPQQERSVSFSPDGRTLVYAAERNDSWDIHTTTIVREEEPYFYASTVLKEEAVVATSAEEFQPAFSPDGKEIAYLEERTTLKVWNMESKKSRTVLPSKYNYSYSDGDQHYQWSPDSKWFLVDYTPEGGQVFVGDVGLVSATGKDKPINLSQSGYSEGGAQWAMGGKAVTWSSDRDGYKSHGSWGGQRDVYALFLTQEAYDRFRLSKEEFELLEKREKDEKKEEEDKDKEDKEDVKALEIEWDNLQDRRMRLTIHSSRLSGSALSPDGEKLYYLASYEGSSDLWMTNTRTRETKILAKGAGYDIQMSKDGKTLYTRSGGGIYKIDASSGSKSPVKIDGEMKLNYMAEKEYIFDHAWRQVTKKFYVKDIHGVDWDFYHKAYKPFLPYITNNHDFAEMLSELLGELNASHTGSGFRNRNSNGDRTASLGVFFDQEYEGNGLKIEEILEKGPLDKAELAIEAGHVIEKINGEEITANASFYRLLNRKSGERMLLSMYNPEKKNRYEEVVIPMSAGMQRERLYQRWVKNRRAEVDKESDGKVGYVHVRGMNDGSFRTVVEEVLGLNNTKESLIVDTRFNGGGWLHDDLATFLSGKKYMDMVPRGEKRGIEPMRKWTKPVTLLVGESNYSDAHLFPVAFRAYSIGKIVGMPVPGTGTAVWWETQIDPTIYFGIPQVGMVNLQGEYAENNQLEPDLKVKNQPAIILKGKDQQIKAAVELLEKGEQELDKKK